MELDCLSCTLHACLLLFFTLLMKGQVLLFFLNVKDPDCLSSVPMAINNSN